MKKILLGHFKNLKRNIGAKKIYALVDNEDFILLKNMPWHRVKSNNVFYAATLVNGKSVQMHHFIVNPPKGYEVDHKDRNGLNNQKINLRICTNIENSWNRKIRKDNTIGYKGVRQDKNKFRVVITVNKVNIEVGRFFTKEEAARAYDEAAVKYFGEFARTNQMMGLLN